MALPIEDQGRLPIEELGRLISRKREGRGIRAAALEANVSPATLSRVENGNVPDLATFAKICRWLEVDPAQFLGVEASSTQERPAVVHFRKKKTVSTDTATSLGALILAAQDALDAHLKTLQQR
ncbi:MULTISPECIES: helix-turn-helix transcriptional regulator [unclassified Novosphingobium]|uniref:helix-turn-helix domain-containing protein n=1 Tax=unclassified Novosphingobium TaxID=2644732 RepID=UPI0025EAD8B2|nr:MULTISPECIES: helix-turn-helix transcriptional regulator [unclassified Novosphingobium]HQV01903.1 helix-turn-helix transcriptional regulator [Novosphingobium sp.]